MPHQSRAERKALQKRRKEYKAKLLDPRWKARRLVILERDNRTCVRCGAKDAILHVHHIRYLKKGEPWDSPDEDLETLCVPCHKAEHGRSETPKAKKKRLAAQRFIEKWGKKKEDAFVNRLFLNPPS